MENGEIGLPTRRELEPARMSGACRRDGLCTTVYSWKAHAQAHRIAQAAPPLPSTRPQLALNFVTLLVMLAVFIIEYWRENFLISCLDIDPCAPHWERVR